MFLTGLKEQLKSLHERPPESSYRIKIHNIDHGIRLDNQKITLGELKELISGSLKLCYLYEPIVKTIEQQHNLFIDVSTTLIKVKVILQILSKGLFYRHMIKLKIDSSVVACLVNNCSTQQNKKVIFAALLSYCSRKLSHQQIASALLIFNLEQALFSKKLQGIPLQINFLHKTLSKIDRGMNTNQLKKFISNVKQDNDSKYIKAFQFIFLVALSNKKSSTYPLLYFYKTKKDIAGISNKISQGKQEKSFDNIEEKRKVTSIHRRAISGLQLVAEPSKQVNKVFKQIKNSLHAKRRCKSTVGIQQKQNKQNVQRPRSAIFRKSINRFDNFMEQHHRFADSLSNDFHKFNMKTRQKISLKLNKVDFKKQSKCRQKICKRSSLKIRHVTSHLIK